MFRLLFTIVCFSTSILGSNKLLFKFSPVTVVVNIFFRHDDTPIFFHIISGLIYSPPQPWTTILATIAIFFAIFNVTTAPVSFIYRYLIICHNRELTALPFIGLCVAAGMGPFAYALTVLIRELQTRDLEEEVKYLFDNTDWIGPDGKAPAFGVMYISKTSVNAYITPVTVVISYSIVIYCTIRISKTMLSLRAMQQNSTGRNRRSQSQLQTVLFFQALVPFCTSGVSTLAIQVGKIFGLSQPWWFYYLNLLNTWSPVANPLVALLVIAPYRKFILHPFNSKSETSSTHQPQQLQQRKHESNMLPNNKVNIVKVIS